MDESFSPGKQASLLAWFQKVRLVPTREPFYPCISEYLCQLEDNYIFHKDDVQSVSPKLWVTRGTRSCSYLFFHKILIRSLETHANPVPLSHTHRNTLPFFSQLSSTVCEKCHPHKTGHPKQLVGYSYESAVALTQQRKTEFIFYKSSCQQLTDGCFLMHFAALCTFTAMLSL